MRLRESKWQKSIKQMLMEEKLFIYLNHLKTRYFNDEMKDD